jgi:hypothetical protein
MIPASVLVYGIPVLHSQQQAASSKPLFFAPPPPPQLTPNGSSYFIFCYFMFLFPIPIPSLCNTYTAVSSVLLHAFACRVRLSGVSIRYPSTIPIVQIQLLALHGTMSWGESTAVTMTGELSVAQSVQSVKHVVQYACSMPSLSGEQRLVKFANTCNAPWSELELASLSIMFNLSWSEFNSVLESEVGTAFVPLARPF